MYIYIYIYNVFIVYVLYTFFGFIHFYCNVMFSSRFFGAFSFMAILMKLVHLCVSPMCSILLFHLALQMFCQSLKSFDIWVFKNTFDLLNQIHSLHSLYIQYFNCGAKFAYTHICRCLGH